MTAKQPETTRPKTDLELLEEMTALTVSSDTIDLKTATALAEVEGMVAAGAALTSRNRSADAAALAELEALVTPNPLRPKPTGGDAAPSEPHYGPKVERAIYQSQIALVDVFRPTPRKRRRDPGYER